jgi:hypothetical protein
VTSKMRWNLEAAAARFSFLRAGWWVSRCRAGGPPKGFLFAEYIGRWALKQGDPGGNFTTPPPGGMIQV